MFKKKPIPCKWNIVKITGYKAISEGTELWMVGVREADELSNRRELTQLYGNSPKSVEDKLWKYTGLNLRWRPGEIRINEDTGERYDS